jgi:hypothetical protein
MNNNITITKEKFVCLLCGQHAPIGGYQDAVLLQSKREAFERIHAGCQPPDSADMSLYEAIGVLEQYKAFGKGEELPLPASEQVIRALDLVLKYVKSIAHEL